MGRLSLTLMAGDHIDLDTASGPIRLTMGQARGGKNGWVILRFEAPDFVRVLRGKAAAKTQALRGHVTEGDSNE